VCYIWCTHSWVHLEVLVHDRLDVMDLIKGHVCRSSSQSTEGSYQEQDSRYWQDGPSLLGAQVSSFFYIILLRYQRNKQLVIIRNWITFGTISNMKCKFRLTAPCCVILFDTSFNKEILYARCQILLWTFLCSKVNKFQKAYIILLKNYLQNLVILFSTISPCVWINCFTEQVLCNAYCYIDAFDMHIYYSFLLNTIHTINRSSF
jgi:hypothetical protein